MAAGYRWGDGRYWTSRKAWYWPVDINQAEFFPLEASFVAKTLTLQWNIAGVATFVSDTLTLQWHINNLVADTVTLQWNILESASLRLTRSNLFVIEEGATSGERQTQVTYASMMVLSGVTDDPGLPAGRRTVMQT